MALRDHFITMSRYHQWATRKLLERIKLIPMLNTKKIAVYISGVSMEH